MSHQSVRSREYTGNPYPLQTARNLNSFLLDQANSQKYVTALEELVKTPMMEASLGFNLYLLSKVERFRGNTAKADDYLDRCKQETPLMYQHLMQQDQYFDLRLLQKQLRMVQR